MLTKGFAVQMLMAVSVLIASSTGAQNLMFTEFSIAVGADSAFAGGASFDGTNYLRASGFLELRLMPQFFYHIG